MRKLFVIFLLTALIPFTTGCNGLWDFDDDNDIAAAAKPSVVVVKPSITLPTSFVTPSLRAQQDAELAVFSFDVDGDGTVDADERFAPDADGIKDNGNGTVTLTFTITIDTTVNTSLFGTNDDTILNGTITVSGQTIQVALPITRVSSDSVATNNEEVIITTDGSKLTVVVTGGQTSTPNDLTASTQYIKKVQYAGADISTDSKNPTTVNSVNPTFLVTFAQKITKINSYSVKVKNVTSGVSATLDQNSSGAFSLTNNGESFSIKVGTHNNMSLKAGNTYEVEFLRASIHMTLSDVGMVGAVKYYFTVATAPKAPVALTSVSGTITANNTTAQTITLNFDGNVAAAPVTGSVVTITQPNNVSVGLEYTGDTAKDSITIAQNADKTKATITFTKSLSEGTYTVSVTKGAWLDTNGNPVEGTSQTFNVQ
jgi:methionine-rich copper-binding protein CopC